MVDAIENTKTLVCGVEAFLNILQQIPDMERVFRSGLQKSARAKDNRIASLLTSSAEERYDEFLNTYPSLTKRIPLQMLAAYLGITPETLSRIRKQKSIKAHS